MKIAKVTTFISLFKTRVQYIVYFEGSGHSE